MPKHASDSSVQIAAEATILTALSKAIGIPFTQGVTLPVGAAHVRPDGVAADESVFVEVFAHIGRLKGGQQHKVSTDALRLLAIRETRPNARLILAFADEVAASSVSGWRAETLKANGIEIHVRFPLRRGQGQDRSRTGKTEDGQPACRIRRARG